MALSTTDEESSALQQLESDLESAHFIPTWVYAPKLNTREPVPGYRPYLWRWAATHNLLMRAGDLITPERGAERRSIDHVNPDLEPQLAATHTIGSAFQLVRPGEIAPAHRHSLAAIRFVVEGGGGAVYTVVDGERLLMEDNDLILTPAFTWHDHANETGKDIIWLDALDYPLGQTLRCSFFEPGQRDRQVIDKAPDFTRITTGALRPPGKAPATATPAVRYAWTDVWPVLDAQRNEPGDPFDGILLEYVNPITGGATLPTISCLIQLLRPNEHTEAHRATSSATYFVVSGSGSTVIDGQQFDWGLRDVFVVPPWCWHEHRAAATDAVLFSLSDRPVLEVLGLYREEPLTNAGGHQQVTSKFNGG
ncbi:MAG: cupin domain-containing protein [Chloroflexi bacterium]|nr:cupin domain-containing protein [Chloroflexota bacterium]